MNNTPGDRQTLVHQVEQCLTVFNKEIPKPFVQVDRLLRRHPLQAVEAYLVKVQGGYRQRLKHQAKVNPGSPQLDKLVVMVFRLGLAINLIQGQEPANKAA